MHELVLTRRAGELLAALRSNGGWLSRADLANDTGKNQLSPNDVKQLETLVSAGIVERSNRPSKSILAEWIYRVIGSEV